MANEYLRPTTSSGGTWTSPTNAYDGTTTSDNATYASETGGDSDIIWSGFTTAGFTYNTLTLHVVHEFVGTANDDTYLLQYSIDGGLTWETPIKTGTATANAKTDFSVTLSASQDLTLIQVNAFLDKIGGGDSGLEARVWEIYTDGEYTPIIYGTINLITPSPTLTINSYIEKFGNAGIVIPSPTINVYETIEYVMDNFSGGSVYGTVNLTIPSPTISINSKIDRFSSVGIVIPSPTIDVYETIEYVMGDTTEETTVMLLVLGAF